MAFMVPTAEYFTESEAVGWQRDAFDGGDGEYDTPAAGWYGRLSAPGYLDCTDWSGPFNTEQEALAYVMKFYGVDENGDDANE